MQYVVFLIIVADFDVGSQLDHAAVHGNKFIDDF